MKWREKQLIWKMLTILLRRKASQEISQEYSKK